jgi:hypothetical protein
MSIDYATPLKIKIDPKQSTPFEMIMGGTDSQASK